MGGIPQGQLDYEFLRARLARHSVTRTFRGESPRPPVLASLGILLTLTYSNFPGGDPPKPPGLASLERHRVPIQFQSYDGMRAYDSSSEV
jgi:hypothetical protein